MAFTICFNTFLRQSDAVAPLLALADADRLNWLDSDFALTAALFHDGVFPWARDLVFLRERL